MQALTLGKRNYMQKKQIKCNNLLIYLRKITRAIDLHSKQLVAKYGVTGPQMVVLNAIAQSDHQKMTSTQLATEVSLSLATITSIFDRLVDRGYIIREKSKSDKRKTEVYLTPKAVAMFAMSPTLLQEEFVRKFEALHDWEQDMLIASLGRVAEMMEAKSIDAAPLLASHELDQLK